MHEQVRQVQQTAAARSMVEEQFLRSLSGLTMPQMVERLAAKFSALKEKSAVIACPPSDDEVS